MTLRAVLIITFLMASPTCAAGVVISGLVLGPEGTPIADVDVDVQDLRSGQTLMTPDDDTGADGRYRVDVPPGRYRLSFEPPAGLRLASHIVPQVDVSGDTAVDVQLAAGIGLAGRITGPDGLGVSGADLDVWDLGLGIKMPTPGDTTNALGFYSVLLPAGRYSVLVDAPLATRLVSTRVDSVELAGDDRILNLRLEPGMILSGLVVDASGVAAADIDVDATDMISGREVQLAEDKTTASGSYAVVLPVGTYRIDFDAPVITHFVSAVIPTVDITGDRTLDVTLERGFIVEGVVFDPDGAPVAGANLDFIAQDTGSVVPTPADNSDLEGKYAVVVPDGTYDLIAWAPPGASFEPDTTRALRVTADTRFDLRFGPEDPPTAPPAVPVLFPAYPNPTPAAATVPFALPADAGSGEIRIFDAGGHLVCVIEGHAGFGGRGEALWDGRNTRGLLAPSGVYFVQLAAGGRTARSKLVVFRQTLSR